MSEPTNASRLSVDPAGPSDRTALESLMQLYAYDWSEIRRSGGPSAPPEHLAQVDAHGRFPPYDLEPYFGDEHRHAFLLRVDDRLAGFALVRAEKALLLDPSRAGFDMSEFFVMRGVRRLGVGARAATSLFDRFRGDWEVRQRVGNDAAIAFWRRTIGAYTSGTFSEVTLDDERWRGPMQSFSSRIDLAPKR